MSTSPRYVSLDHRGLSPIADLQAARVSLLRQIANHQHSLMSGWGGCPQSRTMMIEATSGGTASQVVSCRVPPGVTHVDVSALLQGNGTVTFTTSVDSTGTTLRSDSFISSFDLETAQWYSTDGVYDSTEGAESGRAVQVAAAATWEGQDVDVTVALDASGNDNVQIWALTFRPVHVPR